MMGTMDKRKPLNPLIPLDDLKAFVAKVIAVPKSEIDRREAEMEKRRVKRPRKKTS
jgi:hypothetical protein